MREETLTAALWAALEEDLAALWAAPEGETPRWSPAYAAWEADFWAERPARRRGRRPWLRAILIAAAAAVVLAGTALAASPEIQEAVRQFFRVEVVSNPRLDTEPVVHTDSEGNFYSVTQEWTITYNDGSARDFFAFSFRPDGLSWALSSDEVGKTNGAPLGTAQPREIGAWTLGWLPEGFAPEEEDTYAGENGAYVEFSHWAVDTVNSTTVFELEDGAYMEEAEVNGRPAYLLCYKEIDIKQMYWANQEMGVSYKLFAKGVELKELIQIAESVTLAE